MASNKVEIMCAEYDEGDVFVLKIEGIAQVQELREAVYDSQRYKERYLFDTSELTLYMARAKNGEWLKDDRELGNLLRRGVSADYDKMQPEWTLEECFGKDFTSGRDDVQGADDSPCLQSTLNASTPTTALQLANVWESYEVSDIFRPDSPVVACDELMVMMKSFLYMCNAPPPDSRTKHSWVKYYEALLRIPLAMCRAKSIYFHERRHDASKRPDWVLLYKTLVLMRAEERSEGSHLHGTMIDLVTKMSRWNLVFYENLPYILAYVTAGDDIQVVAIERSSGPCRATPIVHLNLFQRGGEALKVFYNMSMLLYLMAKTVKRDHPCGLYPYVPDIKEHRTLVLLDGVIERTITRTQCDSNKDFERLVQIYTTLEELMRSGSDATHLLTVGELTVKDWTMVVELSPVGSRERPEVDQLCLWLQHLLTALKHWHALGYCHGDVSWRNVVFVPQDSFGYWVLIDMDQSHAQHEGDRLASHA
ncbi:hypothetical protein Poli38472_012780 [Pythium oligandrum]|uniref:Crinkler effector protein N-terminal domain-containing protein n=1 Tax=Pythium oligandrum TaxID=41045 RepID=A0A8K1FI12_PYTOL|nr:hypothetical protein Poli38472_012780 [Pythium oligandrum]|eukprot:TMW61589.1 hypothetical protein Poli38472_012780 [Pythium oligandrum]